MKRDVIVFKNVSLAFCIVMIAYLGYIQANQLGQISGLKNKSNMLLSVACNHPRELESAIRAMLMDVKADLNLEQSIVELRKLYVVDCPASNVHSYSGVSYE